VVAALETVGAPPGKVVRVSLRATYSYLSVQEDDVAGFEALSGRSHGDKVIRIERAKKRR
jgi:ATP-dependent RNA helicase DeaD